MKSCLLILTITLSACSSFGKFGNPYEDMSTTQKAWQVMGVLDVAQTAQFHTTPCHIEVDPVSKHVLGENPSPKNTVAWGIMQSLAMASFDKIVHTMPLPKWVPKKTPDMAVLIVTALKFNTVVLNNHIDQGVRIDGHHVDECSRNYRRDKNTNIADDYDYIFNM